MVIGPKTKANLAASDQGCLFDNASQKDVFVQNLKGTFVENDRDALDARRSHPVFNITEGDHWVVGGDDLLMSLAS